MSKKVLGISWLDGSFRAVSTSGKEVSASWVSPTSVTSDAEFITALDSALRHTGYKGNRVALVIDHPSLLFHVQDAPPAKGKVLRQLLERQIAQNHFYDEPAAWRHAALPLVNGRQRYLLTMLPQSLVQKLRDTCEERNLQLAGVLPVAAVLRAQLGKLSIPSDEAVVLAADLGNALYLLVGRGDGQVLYARSILLSSTQQTERAVQEINRTLHYAQQQFGTTVNQLFVFGVQAYAAIKDLQVRQGLSVLPSPVEEDPFYHAREAALTADKSPLNLIADKEGRNRSLRQLAAVAALFLLISAIATVIRVELAVAEQRKLAQEKARQMEAAAQVEAVAHTRGLEAQRLTALLSRIGSTNDPPVPELFSRYLPTIVPDTVRLTQVIVNRSTNGWQFQLEGLAEESSMGFLSLLNDLEENLRGGTFRTQILDSTHRQLTGTGAPDRAPMATRVGARPTEKPFFVSGLIQ